MCYRWIIQTVGLNKTHFKYAYICVYYILYIKYVCTQKDVYRHICNKNDPDPAVSLVP